MKKYIALLLVTLFVVVTLCGCGSGGVKKVIKEYYDVKLSDADSYSFKIVEKEAIEKSDVDYYDIIEYVTDEFYCDESAITDLQEITVEVKTDYGYNEEYTSYFIVAKIYGEMKIVDKDDGPWSNGYGYGGNGGGGYTITFG